MGLILFNTVLEIKGYSYDYDDYDRLIISLKIFFKDFFDKSNLYTYNGRGTFHTRKQVAQCACMIPTYNRFYGLHMCVSNKFTVVQ